MFEGEEMVSTITDGAREVGVSQVIRDLQAFGLYPPCSGQCWRVLDKVKIKSDMSYRELTLTALWDLTVQMCKQKHSYEINN